MNMRIKHEVTKEVLPKYLKAKKADKTKILDEFCLITGYFPSKRAVKLDPLIALRYN